MRKNKNFILLDTNILIALLDRKDALHSRAKNLIETSGGETFGFLDILLGEAYSVLTRRCKERKYNCKESIEVLQNMEKILYIFKVSLSEYHEKVVENLKKNPLLNYNDWLLLLYAIENDLEILTLDKKLEKEFQKFKGRI